MNHDLVMRSSYFLHFMLLPPIHPSLLLSFFLTYFLSLHLPLLPSSPPFSLTSFLPPLLYPPNSLSLHHHTHYNYREIFISATHLSESSSTALTSHTITTNTTTVFTIQSLKKIFINQNFP